MTRRGVARLELFYLTWFVWSIRVRLDEVYSVVDKDFKAKNKASGDVNGDDGDGGDQNVDEHHQHATILRQLLKLKSSVMVRAHDTAKKLFVISLFLHY